MNSLKVVFLHAKGGCGYVGHAVVISVGCIRAVAVGNWESILWLDVHPMVSVVLASELGLEIALDTLVWGLARMQVTSALEPTAASCQSDPDLDIPNPLGEPPLRRFTWREYCFVFCFGYGFVLSSFAVFLGPSLVFAICPGYVPGNRRQGLWTMTGSSFQETCGG